LRAHAGRPLELPVKKRGFLIPGIGDVKAHAGLYPNHHNRFSRALAESVIVTGDEPSHVVASASKGQLRGR